MKTKKILAAVAALAVVCGAVPSQPFANIVKNSAVTASAADIVEEGKCGENVTYTLDADGVLTISGTGDMDNYDYDYYDVLGSISPFVSPFAYNDRIKSVIIENGVTSIGDSAFFRCNYMTSVEIPDSVTSIGDSAFSLCDKLTSVKIPDGVTRIEDSTFSWCTSLQNVEIPESVKSIHSRAFQGAQWYSSLIDNNDFVVINGILMWGKEYSGDVIIPDSVTSIGSEAFKSSTITSVTIPDSVKNICGMAFFGCRSLTSIEIPASVESIDSAAFWACSSLESITILNPKCEIYDDEGTIKNGTIYGYDNSTAQAYAEKYGREFVSLGEAPVETKLGDVDGDGKITSMDASAVLTYYVMQPDDDKSDYAFNKMAADWDGNGIINAIDASAILTYYVENN